MPSLLVPILATMFQTVIVKDTKFVIFFDSLDVELYKGFTNVSILVVLFNLFILMYLCKWYNEVCGTMKIDR